VVCAEVGVASVNSKIKVNVEMAKTTKMPQKFAMPVVVTDLQHRLTDNQQCSGDFAVSSRCIQGTKSWANVSFFVVARHSFASAWRYIAPKIAKGLLVFWPMQINNWPLGSPKRQETWWPYTDPVWRWHVVDLGCDSHLFDGWYLHWFAGAGFRCSGSIS